MSSVSFVLPKEYAFVAAAAVATGFLNFWQTTVVTKHRTLSGVQYPNCYASAEHAKENRAAFLFNCAQRAHMNTLEHLPNVLVSLVWAGVRYPVSSAALGATWIIGRILYTQGYVTGEPRARLRGAFHTVAELGLYCVGLYSAYEMYTGTW
ncbi:hypothetical protein M408DRAFT_22772 [Serendipita vermifera MAFF 305830]|uniref:Glutathione S-transferase 3, mitochondrial n=1 Tax=Serendipita vermifera MAFF 305830 TaxID=933852 RepID=A0A0C3BD73_SERVB|nr:hypothetical protein M408DRAFT_22772 [Serendipita vermifera MAFF 305830]